MHFTLLGIIVAYLLIKGAMTEKPPVKPEPKLVDLSKYYKK